VTRTAQSRRAHRRASTVLANVRDFGALGDCITADGAAFAAGHRSGPAERLKEQDLAGIVPTIEKAMISLGLCEEARFISAF
jgi:hypothetical protein